MSVPLGLYVGACIVPDVRKLYPGVPFEVDYEEESDEFIIVLHGNINKKITEIELTGELKKDRRVKNG